MTQGGDAMTETKVLIHVRFAPNGAVTEIGERPPTLTAQDWFNMLSMRAGGNYQSLAGGRGIFRLMRGEIAAFQQSVV
jgi:hypothetical protein